MNVAQLTERSGKEDRLAALYLLRVVDDVGPEGARIDELAKRIAEIQANLRDRGVTLRLGYRNELQEFIMRLFFRNLIEVDNEQSAERVVCRLTSRGKSELSQSPPEEFAEQLIR